MNLKGRPMLLLLLFWILIVPTGIVYLLLTQPAPELNWTWVTFSLVLGFASLCFPIIFNGKPVVLFIWFTLPMFLLYGLTTELIITQLIVILATLTRFKTGELLFRVLFNSAAYFILSVGSAAVFFLTGNGLGEMSFLPLAIGATVYLIVYSLLYDGIFRLYGSLTGRMRKDTLKEILLHYVRMIVVVPLSLSLYYILVHYGVIGFLLVGVPFFVITLVLRLNTQKEDLNAYIQEAGQIGQELAKMTNEEAVIDGFLTKTSSLFQAEYVYLYDHHDGWLEPTHFYMKGRKEPVPEVRLASGEGIAGKILADKTSLLYATREEWIHQTITVAPDDLESLLCMPLLRHQEIVGVFVVGSVKKEAFKEFHLKVLDLLSSYFIVAVEKALYIERAEQESNRCALTGLYNYRYLEQRLEDEISLLNRNLRGEVAVVMLDIDHFKSVNDTYGHENGNLVLKQAARLLQRKCPEKSIVARYGGEEFVYILLGFSKEEALSFAEEVRLEVEETPMQLDDGITRDEDGRQLTITVSLGVSAAPEDTDEAMALLRNADRALYIGAKQAGRNRVAGYVK